MWLFSLIVDGVLLLLLINIRKYKNTITDYTFTKIYLPLLICYIILNKIYYHQ